MVIDIVLFMVMFVVLAGGVATFMAALIAVARCVFGVPTVPAVPAAGSTGCIDAPFLVLGDCGAGGDAGCGGGDGGGC